MNDYHVGIDLGTTTCCVSICDQDGSQRVLRIGGKEIVDSVVYYPDDEEEILVGARARVRRNAYPERIATNTKRDMDDPEKVYRYGTTEKTPEQVAADILTYLRTEAGKELGDREIRNAVITVPANFTDIGKTKTKKAAKAAGFRDVRLLQEPVAAALAYHFADELQEGESLFIFDLGGGTLDTAILEVSDRLVVRAFRGDPRLGGADFDEVIYGMLAEAFAKKFGDPLESHQELEPRERREVEERLRTEARRLKEDLSSLESTTSNFFYAGQQSEFSLEAEITRASFEERCTSIFDRIHSIVEDTLKGYDNPISRIAMVGGSSRIPALRPLLARTFSVPIFCDQAPDRLVARGASRFSWILSTLELQVDFASAHTLGIEVIGDEFSPILARGTRLPATFTKDYTTTSDFQEEVEINVYMGESLENCSKRNTLIGSGLLTDIERAPARVPDLKVTFNLNEEDILSVRATDAKTGADIAFEIQRPGASKRDIGDAHGGTEEDEGP